MQHSALCTANAQAALRISPKIPNSIPLTATPLFCLGAFRACADPPGRIPIQCQRKCTSQNHRTWEAAVFELWGITLYGMVIRSPSLLSNRDQGSKRQDPQVQVFFFFCMAPLERCVLTSAWQGCGAMATVGSARGRPIRATHVKLWLHAAPCLLVTSTRGIPAAEPSSVVSTRP